MCTAITFKGKDFYFGRNLDYDFSYGEEVVITPRNYQFKFLNGKVFSNHYSLIGMAHVYDGYPLFYDCVNEKGLSIASLNFVNNAKYNDVELKDKDNIAVHEFIPWLLVQCSSVKEVKKLIKKINLINTPFNKSFPVAQLHFLIADKKECITVEPLENGIKIYDNPVGVLTNNPPFDKQLFNLNNYQYLSNKDPENNFSKKIKLYNYSRGLGGLGLPGDLSSQSRFVRACFVKLNSLQTNDEISSVNQFFHILHSVEQQRGACLIGKYKYEITIFSSCCNVDKGIYYYTTYNNHQINAVNMYNEDLDGDKLIKYELIVNEKINYQN